MENNLIIIDDNNLNSKVKQNYQVIWMTKKEAINHFNKTKKNGDIYFDATEGIKYLNQEGEFRTLKDLNSIIALETIKFCNGNVTEAAKKLSISRSKIYRLIK
ncbi:MAG: DNA-binding NtrC family response regulator [Alphaproteobacteria bacterium]|jgi:DNA-binding NtrC family response regulator|tara:strand:- start:24735 stop:25043 length:309 start_codon:yes stop_codon:yes gene_type:complete